MTTADRAALVDLFHHEASAAGAEVHGPVGSADALVIASQIIGTCGSSVLAWPPETLGIPHAWTTLEADGLTVSSPSATDGKADRTDALVRLGEAACGLTGVVGALADTGTLVLASGDGRSRLAWLLPADHVALVFTDQVYADMAAFFADPTHIAPDQSAHMAFVTGPSRSGDIELTLTRGVHGPKRVHIVLVHRPDTDPR